jgi:F0F1-type ATP synthase membrane subunit b/b'
MAKKADRPVAYTGGMGQYPRPSYYGLTGKFWDRIEKFTNEIVDIQNRRREANAKRMELEEELKQKKQEHEKAKVQAARIGADERPIKRAQKQVEKQVGRINTLHKAIQNVEQDLLQFIREGVPAEVLDDLYNRAMEHQAAYEEYVRKAAAERDMLGQFYALYLWANGTDHDNRDHNRFRPVPTGDYAGRPWYESPLNWGIAGAAETRLATIIARRKK